MLSLRVLSLVALGALLSATACRSEDDDDGGGGATTASGTGTQTTTSPTGTGTGGSTGTGTATSTGTPSGGAGGGGASCSAPAFVAVAEDAGMYLNVFRYIAQTTLGSPVDVLTFELLDGTPAVGTLTISNAGYEDCTNCVRLDRGCDENLANCTKTLLAQGGTIEVTSSGAPGATFAGTLTDAEFVEVTIDSGTGVSTPVTGGEQFCSAPYSFNATIQ